MTRAEKLSITTSARRARPRTSSRPRGSARFSTMLCLPRFRLPDSPPRRWPKSAASRRSTLTTRAPWSARIRVATGPATTQVKSSTSVPSRTRAAALPAPLAAGPLPASLAARGAGASGAGACQRGSAATSASCSPRRGAGAAPRPASPRAGTAGRKRRRARPRRSLPRRGKPRAASCSSCAMSLRAPHRCIRQAAQLRALHQLGDAVLRRPEVEAVEQVRAVPPCAPAGPPSAGRAGPTPRRPSPPTRRAWSSRPWSSAARRRRCSGRCGSSGSSAACRGGARSRRSAGRTR